MSGVLLLFWAQWTGGGEVDPIPGALAVLGRPGPDPGAGLEQAPILLRDWVAHWFPAPARWLAGNLFGVGATMAAFALLFVTLTLVERKVLGRMQNRPGPNRTGPFGLLQPVADGIKLLVKEDLVPAAADKALHFLAPVAFLAFNLLAFAVIPYGRLLVPVDLDAGILFFFAAGAGTELAVFIAGWSSHNKYALLAAMRALAQLISYELPLLLAVVPVVMLAGTLSPAGVVIAQGTWTFGLLPHWHVFTPCGAAGFMLFLLAALAEANRSPFDLPEAESELIAGHLTEYSGFKYALFFMAEYLSMTALSAMAVTLFLGGWQAPCAALQVLPSYLWFILKLLAMLALFMWTRGTLPRLRMDQLMRFSWKFLTPLGLLNLGTAAFWLASAGAAAWPAQLGRWVLGWTLVVAPFVALGRRLGAGVGRRTYRYAT